MNPLLARMVTGAAAAAAAVAARRAAEAGWRLVQGSEPPSASDVADDTQLRDLLLWSAVVAAGVVIARKLAVSQTERLLGVDDR